MKTPTGKSALPLYTGNPTQWAIDLFVAGRCFNPDDEMHGREDFTGEEASYINQVVDGWNADELVEFQSAMVREMHRANSSPRDTAEVECSEIIDSAATLARCRRGRKVLRAFQSMLEAGDMLRLDSSNRACLSHLFTMALHGNRPALVQEQIASALQHQIFA